MPARSIAAVESALMGHKAPDKAGAHKPFKGPVARAVKAVKGQKPPPPAAPPAAIDTMDVQFQRAIEAITMYDKAERDRTWADAPSK